MNQSNQPPPSYPEAQTIVTVSLSTLLDANRHVCEVCYQGFPRLQNLSFHQKTHNRAVTTFKRKTANDVQRKVYLCPEPTCTRHNRSHALGDFAGLKKHYLRKHSTHRNYKCNKCPKAYAVSSDLTAHLRICRMPTYKCDCGAHFSSHDTFNVHLEKCDALEHEGAAKDPPISNSARSSLIGSSSSLLPRFDMIDTSGRSIGNNNTTSSLISSTTSPLPVFNMGDSLVRSININNNSSSLGGSTTSSMPTFGTEYNLFRSTGNACLSTTPNQSQLYHFAKDRDCLVTDPSMSLNLGEVTSAFFPPSTTQQSHQDNFDMWFYTNLMMNNIPFDNVTLDDISFMTYGGNHGRPNSFTDVGFTFDSSSSLNSKTDVHNASWGQELLAPQPFLNKNSVGSSSGNINYIVQDNTNPYSSSAVEFITPQEHIVSYGNPELAWNEHLPVSTSRINSSCNMVQGYASSPSSGSLGFIFKPLEQDVLFGSEPIAIANNSGSNPFMTPVSGSGIGSSLFNQDVGGNYLQEDYYGLYGYGSHHYDYAGGHRSDSPI